MHFRKTLSISEKRSECTVNFMHNSCIGTFSHCYYVAKEGHIASMN